MLFATTINALLADRNATRWRPLRSRGTLAHLPADTTRRFRFGQGDGEMMSMTSREAALHFFTDVHRAISPEAPDIPKLVEIANQHQVTLAAPPGPQEIWPLAGPP